MLRIVDVGRAQVARHRHRFQAIGFVVGVDIRRATTRVGQHIAGGIISERARGHRVDDHIGQQIVTAAIPELFGLYRAGVQKTIGAIANAIMIKCQVSSMQIIILP